MLIQDVHKFGKLNYFDKLTPFFGFQGIKYEQRDFNYSLNP